MRNYFLIENKNKQFNYKELRDKIIASVSLELIISRHLKLNKVSNNASVCPCPFHSEKTASFRVNNDKNYYYCFGCKEYGNCIDFLMKYKNIEFKEAIRELKGFCQ